VSDDLHRRFAALQETGRDLAQFQAEVNAATTRSDNWNRHYIVACVVGVYVFAVVAAIIYLFWIGLRDTQNTFADMAEVLKIGIVPIVTLVIGYYFSSKRD
jgi:hypothetical protein